MRKGAQFAIRASAGLIEEDTRLVVLQLTISQLAFATQVKFANFFEFLAQRQVRLLRGRLAATCRFVSFRFILVTFTFTLISVVKGRRSGRTSATTGTIDAVDHFLLVSFHNHLSAHLVHGDVSPSGVGSLETTVFVKVSLQPIHMLNLRSKKCSRVLSSRNDRSWM